MDFDYILGKISQATEVTMESLREEEFSQEANYTDRLLGAIKMALTEGGDPLFRWRTKTYSDRGPSSEESILGADIGIQITIESKDVSFKKSVLIQSKLQGKSPRGVRESCRKMGKFTKDAYVVDYSATGISVYPGSIVANLPGDSSFRKYPSKRFDDFMRDFFYCFIGDHDLDLVDILSLDLREPELDLISGTKLLLIDGKER